MRAADQLIDSIVKASEIPSGRRREEIQRELRCHIEDFVTAAYASGRDPCEIEKLVLAHFGDPRQIAGGFAWVYRHERRWRQALVFTFSTMLLASSLFGAILATQTGLAFVFGTPILKVLASRHTVIEALDILASVAAYLSLISLEKLFKAHRFQKAALLLTLIGGVLIASCAIAGLHVAYLVFGLVTGIFCRALQRFVTWKVARAGLVAVCFPLAGLALLRPPASQVAVAATCASWLAMGIGYQLMTDLAARVDQALQNGFSGSKGEIT